MCQMWGTVIKLRTAKEIQVKPQEVRGYDQTQSVRSGITEMEMVGKHCPGLSTSLILAFYLNKEMGIQTDCNFRKKCGNFWSYFFFNSTLEWFNRSINVSLGAFPPTAV